MKLRIVSLLCLFLAIACSTDDVNNTETATADNSITLNQKIVDQLLEDGYEAILTDDDKIISVGFKNLESFISKINNIYDVLELNNHKIDINTSSSQNRVSDTQCEQGEPYTSDDGASCVTYVCWGTGLAPVSMGSAGDVHYYYYTACSGGN